eukprot:CAMPEP_0170915984 /NCGR_PEP_ID=MMETSP0735-20130129/6526_1 /TAXON_ID=186038 /ORGANISM="Fragilariopsis kerguelensis, Strain L26-C5" /LENGTH=463 /DNA_ID=CAMNT_0011314003 /DNA_START=69 /DNA_END=1461 /DNA_ORIENTATION=+
MKKTNESQRLSSSVFRARPHDHPHIVDTEPTARSPLVEFADLQGIRFNPVTKYSGHNVDVASSAKRYDENDTDEFELMNVKIIVYGLIGLAYVISPVKRQRFGSKKEISSPAKGVIGKGSNRIVSTFVTDVKSVTKENSEKDLGLTIASYHVEKCGISNQISLEKFLPSLPLGRLTDTRSNKVRCAASWPSEQSALQLQQADGAMERSAFEITRCMKQNSFVAGIGARSNFCHETIELGINISRGTELIRLGTALVVFNGEEEGEILMNIPTTPLLLNNKKLKKKKNKYGYFSNDSSRRYYLDDNSILKVGVQVIPEEAMRVAREKDKERIKEKNKMNDLLEQDKLKNLVQNMSDNKNLDHEGIQIKSLHIAAGGTAGTSNGIIPEKEKSSQTYFPDIFCGSMPVTVPTSWVSNFFRRSQNEPEIPIEITTTNNIDQMAISSIMSSISESVDGSIFEDYTGEI